MSSKFRARALDASKPMPIFRADELPDLPDFAAINRAVPLMPSGMEKEEECEHHLQRAMSAQQAYGQTGDLVIPTPEVYECSGSYEFIYPDDFKVPRQIIHMQPSAMEQDIPDYDMDSEDERWMMQQSKKMEVTPLQFEEMMDRLEKGSGQQVVTLKEAKSLLKEDDDLIISVYDYWLNKRLRMQHPLIPQVRTEKRDGSTNNNPYVAFRRRTEKMQTRKNRKNDEASYEKMLKLRRDLSRAVTLLEMVKRREKAKREHLHLTVEIFEKRFQAGDFSGQILAEVSAMRNTKPSYISLHNSNNNTNSNSSQYTINRQPEWPTRISKAEVGASRKKREYKKRKHKEPQAATGRGMAATASNKYVDVDTGSCGLSVSSEDEIVMGVSPEQEDENDPDGQFAFRRKKYCNYHAPIPEGMGNWPWCSATEGGLADRKYRYCLTSLSEPSSRCVGFARRRVGRGGRLLLDRARTPLDGLWSELDRNDAVTPRSQPRLPNGLQPSDELWAEVRNEWLHFRPQTPPPPEGVGGSDSGLNARRLSCGSQPDVVGGVTSDSGATLLRRRTEGATGGGAALGEETVVGEAAGDTLEFNVESFQSHQEELLAMQRRQTERQMASRGDPRGGRSIGDDASAAFASSSSSSQFTVDSAGAQFAVSAVVNAACVWGAPTAPCPLPMALSNGPTNARRAGSLSIPASCRAPLDRTLTGHLPRSLSNPAGVTRTGMMVARTAAPLKSAATILSQLESTTGGDIVVESSSEATSRTINTVANTTSATTNPKTKVDRLLNENSLPMEVT